MRANVRAAANAAEKRGQIINPGACEVAGCGKYPEKHHDDYSKPLDVRWLCRKHHLQHHRGEL